jgi:hypothetical protein
VKRMRLIIAAAGALALIFRAERAWAQGALRPGITVSSQPVVSPYVNLLRTTSGLNLTAVNYYGIVRPEFAFQGAISGLQQQVDVNQQLITTGIGGTVGPITTGHPAYFLSTAGYFLTTRRGAVIGAGGVVGGPTPGGAGGAFAPGSGGPAGGPALRSGLAAGVGTPPATRGR